MVGVALLVVAATLAITITVRKPVQGDALVSNDGSARSEPRTQPRHPLGSPSLARSTVPQKSETRRVSPGSAPEQFTVNVPAGHPQHAQLTARAREVEAQAKSELAKFTKRLDLTGEQQRRLFPILARSSEKYDAAMRISGYAAGAPPLAGSAGREEFNEVLEPTQRDQLVEDAITDQLLWQDIIGKLRQRLDEQTPQVPEAASEDSSPTPPAPRGRRNLFDTVNPQP